MFAEGKMSHFLCCATKDTHMERNIFESRVHKADQQVPCEKPANASAYSLLNNLSRCWELKNHQGFNCTPLCQVQAPIPRWRNNPGAPGPLQGLYNTGKKKGFGSILDCQICTLIASRGNFALICDKWKFAFLVFLCASCLAGTTSWGKEVRIGKLL